MFGLKIWTVFRVVDNVDMADDTDDVDVDAGFKDIHKKTMTKWINSQLERTGHRTSVTDLYYDLRDGRVLVSIL